MAAAASTATGTIAASSIAGRNHVSTRNYRASTLRSLPTTYCHTIKQRGRLGLSVRSSTDESATATETESTPPAEVPKGPPSLISSLNVEKALRGIAITEADHYGRLGLRTGCSYDQVSAAYKNKVALLMNRGLTDEQLSEELELLKESHSILSSPEERRLYDWGLARTGKADTYVWPFEVDITQPQPGTPPPQEPEDEGPTRLTGYFFLSWIMLSFILFIAFNR